MKIVIKKRSQDEAKVREDTTGRRKIYCSLDKDTGIQN
jgi:hypothetical protein